MNIAGKTAIVTGGASGLGLATVKRYVELGANVAIFDMNEELGSRIAAELGEQVLFVAVNVADEESVQNGINAVVDRFGALHVVNNFAGIASPNKTLGKKGPHPLADYLKVIMVNQVGTFNVARLAAEKMAHNEPVNDDGARGVIIHTASIAAYEGQIGQVSYSASKGAIVGMTLPMARDLAAYGIRVNTIVPGLIHTPMFDTIEESYYNALVESTVYPRRLGKPEEIALLSAHIVENDYINGECIRMDAAVRMQPK
ncbi:SDR family NAD(P)-dependent oxidoreductase [Halioxenophilus sp. WMMB6]|uniref:SDR family NAD(P)-dependent oxidoreductase n=1 Tax=Halioxenophilus sp. WMMB6 TaxID=3073815 RepID=UPI00295E9E55|nr:SDR family NAD(P)-dependent oxidoreductase [Halioxenophilus sp. WMMB6]